MEWSHLTPEQAEQAEQLYQGMKLGCDEKLRQLAALLASKTDDQLLGKTEYEVRDLVHEIGTDALQTAAEQRKKGGTEVPA